jgi:hypothetical protein
MGYIVLDTQTTIQVISPTTVLDIEYVTASTTPTGVIFAYPLLEETWQANGGGETLGNIATAIENLVTSNHVVGGSNSQDLDNSGLLVDYVDLIVEYDPPNGLPLQSTVSVPISAFVGTELGIGGIVIPGIETPEQYVEAEYDRLVALVAAGGS